MAYKTTVSKICATRDIALTEIYAQMEAMGWVLVDGALTPKVIPYTSVDITNNWCTCSGHGLVEGYPVQITTSGTIPGGLAINTQYYVRTPTADTFKLATTYNGSVIDITTQGTVNHTIKEAYRIYKSNGENSDKIYEYLKIQSYQNTTTIMFLPSYYYNLTTRAQQGLTYLTTQCVVTTNETGFTLWIHGDKNLVAVSTKIVSTYYRAIFGHMNKSLNTLVTTLTNSITTGTNVTITVASTVGFDLISTYMILGANGEGRDPMTVTSILSTTQMIVSNVARNYSAGSFIGIYPSLFGSLNSSANNWYIVDPIVNHGGLTDCGNFTYGQLMYLKDITSIDPDGRSGKYLLQPIFLSYMLDGTSTYNAGHMYNDEYILISPQTGLVAEDTFAYNNLDSGTSSGSNDTTIFNDTSKSWTINAYAGKVIVTILGTGSGQIKKIASNTATAITLESGWTFITNTDNTTQYIICDEAYRYFPITSYISTAHREGY